MTQFQLTDQIIAYSRSQNWVEAKPEWELLEVYRAKEPRTCLCGHSPIIEICNLQNKVTGAVVTVGNHCVKTVLGLPSGRIAQALRRVRADPSRSLNKDALAHARKRGWITALEYDLYFLVMRRRKLSSEEREQRLTINERFIHCMQPPLAQPLDDGIGHAESVDEASERNLPAPQGRLPSADPATNGAHPAGQGCAAASA